MLHWLCLSSVDRQLLYVNIYHLGETILNLLEMLI